MERRAAGRTVGIAVALAASTAVACSGSRAPGGGAAGTTASTAVTTPADAAPGGGGPGPVPGAVLQGGRFSYCDPAPLVAAYPRFTEIPAMSAALYPGGTPRDYPVIDAHTHLSAPSDVEADIQRRAGLYAAVDAAWDAASTARLRATYPKPNVVEFSLNDYLYGLTADAVPGILAHFDEQRAAGAGGVKVFKGLGLEIDDAAGKRLAIDDPRLAPIWEQAGQERWTVSIHTADPDSWLQQYYPTSPYSKQDLVQQLVHVVAAHPNTVFVAIHLMNLIDTDQELDQLGALLDTYPNLYADVAARSQDLAARDQAHVRAFMIQHQDQLLFGTDRIAEPDPVTAYQEEFKYWETSLPARTYYQNRNVPGLALPPVVLEKLYYRNALRAYCAAFQ